MRTRSQKLVSCKEAAEILGLSRSYIYDLVRRGRLDACRLRRRGHIYLRARDVDDYMRQREDYVED